MTRSKERRPAATSPEAVEPAEREQVKRLMSVEVSGIVVSMIKPLPESDPGAVEIHVFEASKNSPFVTNLEDGVGIFGKILEELRTKGPGDLDKLIARAEQAYYSEKKR